MGNCSFEEEPSIPLEQELSDQDGRGKCCSESLFHCCCCPGSVLAQAKIGRDLFLLPAACNSPLIFSNWFCQSTEDMLWCFTLPSPFSEIGKAERCFPMPGNCSPWIQSRCDFVLLLYVGISSPLPCVARRCSSIANHTSSVQKDPSQDLQDSIREVCGVCSFQSTAVSFGLVVIPVRARLLWKSL